MRFHGAKILRILRRKVMVTNVSSLSALLFAHMFEKYVDFVEEGNLLDHIFNRYFRTFEIDVFFEHVCKMLMAWLLNRHTCSRNTLNLLPECAYFAHVFEKYNDFAVDPVGLAVWLAETQHAVSWRKNITYYSKKSDGCEYAKSVNTFVCTRVREIRGFY